MNAAVSMLLFLMLFATFVTLGVLRRSIQRNNFYSSEPARVIVPKRYAWKGAKWIREITFLDRDILGFWELRGYSNTADPWTDDRFS